MPPAGIQLHTRRRAGLRSVLTRARLKAAYAEEADRYFWLREPPDGSDVDVLRERVAAVYFALPPTAFMMLDAAVAGEPQGASAVLDAVPHLPEHIGGIPVREALTELAGALSEAPPPPPDRRALVEHALTSVDVGKVEEAIDWVADTLGFVFPQDMTMTIDTYVVAAGVPLGGLTGRRIDDSRICFVAVRGQEGSTFAEALIHEATHVLDSLCDADTSLIARLRSDPQASRQLWHAPYFVAAAEATRRFVDPNHHDFGDTHGYYARVPDEMAILDAGGIVSAIRSKTTSTLRQ